MQRNVSPPSGQGSVGKGKRRFAPQGVWRSGGGGPDVEPVVWLPRVHQKAPIPLPQEGAEPQLQKPQQKDEYYLAEVS